jgi:hypothetical protein
MKNGGRVSLEIKTWSSPDVDIYHWVPDEPAEVRFLLEMEIGTTGDERTDIFQVVVATPEGLRAMCPKDVIRERATLILSEYSWGLLKRTCTGIVDRCAASTWNESVLRLQRYFAWEYEDYNGT